jgi:cellulose synthase/poly-beta-1,6-N-acetylglucosamine synthase-like glycosyltransferase
VSGAGGIDTGAAAALLAGIGLFGLVVSGYAYLGYPLVARLLVPRRRKGAADAAARLPALTVLVAARNEALSIRERIENLLGQGYPDDLLEVLVVSDASDDGTDEIVREMADPRVRLVRQPQCCGKTAGINRIAPEARGAILVQTDANVMFGPGTLEALARAFADPRVGVALGEVTFVNEDEPWVAGGEGLYWRFETWTKRIEAERGLLAVANGGIYALRRSLWRRLPPQVAGDAAEPLLAAQAGFETVIAPGARAFERAASSLGEEFRRKTRIIAQQVACARWVGLDTLPPRILWAYGSHKLLRYIVPFLLVTAAVAGAAAWLLGWWPGALLVAAVVVPLLLAPLGLLGLPGLLGRVCKVPLYFVMINAASAVGMWRGVRGRAEASWAVGPSTRCPAGSSRPFPLD